MKNDNRAATVVRSIAVLLLVCMLVPQFASCKAEVDDPVIYTELENYSEEQDGEVPEVLVLKTAHGFSKKGNILNMDIASEDPILDLTKRFSVADGSEYSISTDEAGENKLADESVSLTEGENVFYVTVNSSNESYTYKAVVNYTEAYTVEFYSNCDDYIEAQAVNIGNKVTRPADPTRDGYTFLGWYLDGQLFEFDTAPSKSCTLIAHWDKNDKSIGSYYTSSTAGYDAVKFTDISAGLRVVWKDYANSGGVRPDEVVCVLKQTYGDTVKEYEIIVRKDSAEWVNPQKTPCICTFIGQGEGGDWTLSLKRLPGKVGSKICEYKLTQKPLAGDYTTKQAGGAVYNTIAGYVPSIDKTAKLTTRNARLYDAAGNLVVFNGVVSGNIDWGRSFNDLGVAVPDTDAYLAAPPNYDIEVSDAMQRLVNTGCNALRATVPIVGSLKAYVYWAKGIAEGQYRTGWYIENRDNPELQSASESDKRDVIARTCAMIDAATAAGLYIIIDWPILTSNPYDYLDEAKDFFGRISARYADNPYVLYEICNEPGSCAWSDGKSENDNAEAKGIKAYAEEIIKVIRGNGSDGIIVVGSRAASTGISMSPVVFGKDTDKTKGYYADDPISDPLDDDMRYNVAYTFHCYPYANAYSDSDGRNSYGWRIRDAYNAGLTLIVTEMSPMDSGLDRKDPISYDMDQMAKYLRMFQEYDISYFYFKYVTSDSSTSTNHNDYTEWNFFQPGVDPRYVDWGREHLTECGRWYYNIVTGDAIFVRDVNYSATHKENIRTKYKDTFSAYGLTGDNFFTVYPGFAYDGVKLSDGTYYFRVDNEDTLSDIQYERYCQVIWNKISGICGGTAKQENGNTFTWSNVPLNTSKAMKLTYIYGGKTCNVDISYGQHTNGTYGVFVHIY